MEYSLEGLKNDDGGEVGFLLLVFTDWKGGCLDINEKDGCGVGWSSG
jgi:hypothetical protein